MIFKLIGWVFDKLCWMILGAVIYNYIFGGFFL